MGERGVTLSGGQKQRVALARVLLKNPRIIVLDDTTSALDTETESRICRALKERLQQRTAFIITHRLSTAAAADRILVLDQGELVQQGTHDELIAVPGIYRRLHRQQWTKQSQLTRELHHAERKTCRNRIPQAV